jgi:hypothetical protein
MAAIAVAGSIAQRPGRPGHAWAFLAYLLGLRALGYDVVFLDRVGSTAEASWLAETMRRAGLEDSYAGLCGDQEPVGLSRRELRERLRGSPLLLNVNGFLDDPELLEPFERRAYLDIDPGFAQIWEAQGLADTFVGHDCFVTVGTNVGAADSRVPTGGREWVTTLPPVPLEAWAPSPGGEAFTSVGSWRGPFGPLEHEGESYGLRVHQFRRFLELPRHVPAPFQLALDIDPADDRDRAALSAGEWGLLDPLAELAGFEDYGRFLRGSLAEIAIAKGIYVDTNGGWFSDRSATYLACGKPVIAQETGFSKTLPTGEGLLSFTDLDGAVQAVETVLADPYGQAEAARALAEEHLDARVVVARLLEELEVA